MIARVRHEMIRLPSTRTVQAPHCPWSHPFFVPVRSRYSRRASSRVVHGATSNGFAAPLTLRVMRLFAGNDAVGFIGASCSGVLFMLTPSETAWAVSRREPIPSTAEVKCTMARGLSGVVKLLTLLLNPYPLWHK